MTPAEQAQRYITALLGGHGGLSGYYVTLWTAPDGRTRWLPADQPEAIASAIAEADSTTGVRAVYLGVGLSASAGQSDRRMVDNPDKGIAVAGLLGVILDVDIAGPGHDQRRTLPPNEDAARRVIRSMHVEPTMVVHSGGGLHAYWLFTEPLIFGQVDSDDDGVPVVDPERVDSERADAADLLWSWVTTARHNARALAGWWVDPVGDITRLLRVPGSTNRKDSPLPVVVLEHAEHNRYDVDDLRRYCLDPKVLEQYRRASTEIAEGVLAGVDVHAVWARIMSPGYSKTRYLPPWLAQVIATDAEWGEGRIGDTFEGRRPDLQGDGNVVDASLVRLLADADVEPEMICEAVMCRRLRSGEKVEKVDPSRRVDYLIRTVGRFVAESRARREQVAQRERATRDTIAAMFEVEATPERESAQPHESVASVTALPVEPARTPAPVSTPARKVEENGGRSQSRGDLPPLTNEMQEDVILVTKGLALPVGYSIRGAQWRAGIKHDEMRLWVRKGDDASDPTQGHTSWPVGESMPTRWRPKSGWEKPGEVVAYLLRDLHVMCDEPPKGWFREGLRALYRVAQEDLTGTPRAAVAAAARDYLFSSPPIASFAEARDAGHPWLSDHRQVAVLVDALRRSLHRLGDASSLSPEQVRDIAQAMGCEVWPGLAITEDGRMVRDERDWIVLAPSLLTPEQWTELDDAVAAYQEQRTGTHLRVVP